MEQRVSLVTLGVADLERSLRFYGALGWRRGNKDDGVAFFQIPGAVFALWSRGQLAEDARVKDTGASFSGIVLAYNTRNRAEVDAVLAEAEAAGAAILKAAEETPWGGYSGYFADPDGHPWEVAHNPDWPLAADGSVSLVPPA
jgi:catechol 2,3-dioxygenase-like lactoylglutathione lyase family enzyme